VAARELQAHLSRTMIGAIALLREQESDAASQDAAVS
jgi:hypothetical protein